MSTLKIENSNQERNNRPILIIANSSWYLVHYRSLLLEQLKSQGNHILSLAPIDSSTSILSKSTVHIPWKIYRSRDSNPASLIISLIRMLLLVRAIKPRLVHSHTLKSNLLASLATSIFGIPCVLSFAGMGKLSISKGRKKKLLLVVLQLIELLSLSQRKSRWKFERIYNRTAAIIQNPDDLIFFKNCCTKFKDSQINLIVGSGVPNRYFENGSQSKKNNLWLNSQYSDKDELCTPKCDLIFCGRLLKSKGIEIFVNLAALLENHNFIVYGGVDISSKDSFTEEEIRSIEYSQQNLKFQGNIEDPLMHMEYEYPILVVPSSYGEGLPRSIAESLALNVPVICSLNSTCGIFTNKVVYIAKGNRPADYVKSMECLISDYKSRLLKRRISDGYQLSKGNLSESKIVAQTLEVYEHIEKDRRSSYLLDKGSILQDNWLAQ